MDLAQSELNIYISTETKEKAALDSMREQLEQATTNYSERKRNLQELEKNLPNWTRALAEKQAELQQVNTNWYLFSFSKSLTFFLFI